MVPSLSDAVDKTLKDNPDKVAQIKEKPYILGWMLGNVISKMGGTTDPDRIMILLRERLGL